MSAHKEIICTAAKNGVDTHVRWNFIDSGHFVSDGVDSAIAEACGFLSGGGKDFNYDEVLDAVYDLIYRREQKVRMRISGILP